MIRVENAMMTIKGERAMVLSELTTVIHHVFEIEKKHNGEAEAKEMIAEIVRLALMSDEELNESIKREVVNAINGMLN